MSRMPHERRLSRVSVRQRVRPLLALLLVLVVGACALPGASQRQSPASGHTTASVATYRLTYVAIGASDSVGVGTEDPDRDSWPTVLSELLGQNVHLINLGIPGATVAEAQRAELPIALASNPTVVTVWLAVNDLAAGVPVTTYQQQLGALVTSLKRGTHARIFVADLPDLTELPFFAQQDLPALAASIRQWNAAISAVCAQDGATLVDLFSGWRELANHPEYIAGDGLHPSTIGAQRLAQVFAAAVQRPQTP
jgi:acyl-CoA thioesterase I